jgi:hypothetical protein
MQEFCDVETHFNLRRVSVHVKAKVKRLHKKKDFCGSGDSLIARTCRSRDTTALTIKKNKKPEKPAKTKRRH